MKIILIVAVDRNNGIGFKNNLIVRSKEDMQHFVATTKGHPVVVGRNTYESLPSKQLLGRHLIVVSKHYTPLTSVNLSEATLKTYTRIPPTKDSNLYKDASINYNTMYVAGGAQLYQHYLDTKQADGIILTQFNRSVDEVDTYFPEIPKEYKIANIAPQPFGNIYTFYK